jgi:putative hydrolase of the HAD superfamily
MAWPRAILFDLDDTLILGDALTDASWMLACDRYWARTPAGSATELREAIRAQSNWFYSDLARFRQGRMNLDETRHQLVAGALQSLGQPSEELSQSIAAAYAAEKDRTTALVPGAVETLIGLRAAGVTLGLITNGQGASQRQKIERFELAPFFDTMVIEGEFGAGKPNPSVYVSALAVLGVDAADAWMVGDNLEFDVAASQRLGLRGVWVDFRGHGLPAETNVRPDAIVHAVSELSELL